ncbi:MAG: hypothetical protein ACKO85_18395, partial [Isosphaeraceae bacterium]
VLADSLAGMPFLSHAMGLLAFVAISCTFLVWGATRLEIGSQEARLGMAARESFGPVGQSFGGLDPGIYPGPVALLKAFSVIEKWNPGQESIRWTSVICAGLIGIAITLRTEWKSGKTAALAVALCWFSSVALLHRTGEMGIDFYLGAGLVLALNDTIAQRGQLRLRTGIYTAIAFLCGGLAPVILVVAASIIICRSSAGLRPGFLAFVIATVGGWSAWALNEISAEAWAAAIALPVVFRSGSSFPSIVMILCLPMVLAVPAFFSQKLRSEWAESSREYTSNWWTIASACLFVGTVLPQFSRATLLPIVAGCSVIAGHVWATAWQSRQFAALGFAGRWLSGTSGLLVVAASAVIIPFGVYLSIAIPYYRWTSLACLVLAIVSAGFYFYGNYTGKSRQVIMSIVLLAICIKTAHTAIYVPEWNYRRGQGPWGRAIGQWVPAGWPIYTLHGWPTDLAFATGHNFRQITAPRFLPGQDRSPDGRPVFILLHPADFERWPKSAAPIRKVFEFQDQSGFSSKILARTGGEKLNWLQWTSKKYNPQAESSKTIEEQSGE